MAALTTLVPDIQAEIPELPSFIAERQLLRALREFCQETRAWREAATLSVVENVATLNIAGFLPTNSELIDVITLKPTDGSEEVKPTTYAWLDKNLSDWRDETASTAKYYVQDGSNVIRFVYTPDATVTDKYYIRFSVKPTLSATTIDDVLVNKFDQRIIYGALGRLYFIPRKPWTDFNLGQYYTTMFQNSWAEVRAEAVDEFQVGVPRKVKYGGL